MEPAHEPQPFGLHSIPPFLSTHGLDYGHFQLFRSRLRSGTMLLPRHDCCMIILTFGGVWGLRAEHQAFDVSPGEMAIVSGRARCDVDFRGSVDNLVIRIDPEFADEIARELGLDVDIGTLRPQKIERPAVRDLARSIDAELQRTKVLHQNSRFANALVTVLMGQVLSEVDALSAELPSSSPRLSSGQIAKAAQYIDASLDGEVSLPAVAAHIGLSQFHFSRAFKNATGMGFHQFVVKRRVDRAKELLGTSARLVLDVGADVGFRNHSHFSSIFRRHIGMTPTEYRRRSLR